MYGEAEPGRLAWMWPWTPEQREQGMCWREGSSIIGNNLDDTFDIIWKNIANLSQQHYYCTYKSILPVYSISPLLSTLPRTGKALIVNYRHCRSVESYYNNQPKQFPVGYATTTMCRRYAFPLCPNELTPNETKSLNVPIPNANTFGSDR